MGNLVPVAWTEQQPLRGGKHWTVKTLLERLDGGNAPLAGFAGRPAVWHRPWQPWNTNCRRPECRPFAVRPSTFGSAPLQELAWPA